MIRLTIFTALCLVVACLVAGCNAGMEAQGPTAQEAQDQISKLPPAKQIDLLRHSPLPKAEQDKRVAEIQSKYGLPATKGETSPNPGQPPAPTGK